MIFLFFNLKYKKTFEQSLEKFLIKIHEFLKFFKQITFSNKKCLKKTNYVRK